VKAFAKLLMADDDDGLVSFATLDRVSGSLDFAGMIQAALGVFAICHFHFEEEGTRLKWREERRNTIPSNLYAMR
jgi:hypothetical protein